MVCEDFMPEPQRAGSLALSVSEWTANISVPDSQQTMIFRGDGEGGRTEGGVCVCVCGWEGVEGGGEASVPSWLQSLSRFLLPPTQTPKHVRGTSG